MHYTPSLHTYQVYMYLHADHGCKKQKYFLEGMRSTAYRNTIMNLTLRNEQKVIILNNLVQFQYLKYVYAIYLLLWDAIASLERYHYA